MKDKILKIIPSKHYQEGLLEIEEGMDNIPEVIDYLQSGYSLEHAKKMNVLVRIELLKKSVKSVKEEVGSSEEIQEAEAEIQLLIDEYNRI